MQKVTLGECEVAYVLQSNARPTALGKGHDVFSHPIAGIAV